MSVILTERLRLRPLVMTDAEDLHAALADPEAMAYWSTPPHTSLEETRAWLQATIDTPAGSGEDFAVECDGRVIGKAGLWRFPEVGYILRRDAWGRGYAAEALAPVLDRAFGSHGLDAVIADVDPRNLRSLSLLARLGFEETGRAGRTLRVGETWCDSVYLRLGAADWARRTSPLAQA